MDFASVLTLQLSSNKVNVECIKTVFMSNVEEPIISELGAHKVILAAVIKKDGVKQELAILITKLFANLCRIFLYSIAIGSHSFG